MSSTIGIDAAHAYRLVDALRDYALLLETDCDGGDDHRAVERAQDTALRIENSPRLGYGLRAVEQFDLEAAQAAVVALVCEARAKAESLRAEAEAAEGLAGRWEKVLVL